MSRLNDIVRERYATGAHGRAHIAMACTTFDALPRPDRPADPWQQLADLLAIPVVLDNTLPAGTWQLVDTDTGTVLEKGSE